MNDKDFLLQLKIYIENMEEKVDNEWGSCRKVEKLITDGKMPEIYFEILDRLKEF